ncbi:hypothetical protein ACOKXV_05255, partial [Sporosarcina psychrophila]|uniref:hypothetical protein n=1 Tax=Sporosarcina psychrophila TaxID=1476 RepID=UPI003BA1C7D2
FIRRSPKAKVHEVLLLLGTREERAPHWIKAAKDSILAAGAFSMVFSFLILGSVTFDRGLHDVKYKPY